MLIIFSIICIFSSTFVYLQAKSYSLLFMFAAFFLIKILSDSLFFYEPLTVDSWRPIKIFGFSLEAQHLFSSNLDIFIGICLLFLYFFIERTQLGIIEISMIILISLFIISYIFYALVFSWTYSFTIFSSLIAFGFAVVATKTLRKKSKKT